MKQAVLFALICFGSPALSDIVVPARTIRAKQVITDQDVLFKSVDLEGVISDLPDVVGMEARVALYPGRPIRFGDVGPPAIVGRNDLVTLVFDRGGLSISTEGRALGRGSEGDVIRAMNLSSRTTVSGRIRSDGAIEVY